MSTDKAPAEKLPLAIRKNGEYAHGPIRMCQDFWLIIFI